MKFNGEIALVTGASRGIGAAIAALLAKSGARVVGTATTQQGADSISMALASTGPDSFGYVLDVRNDHSVELLLGTIEQRFNESVSILVNNAGITQDNLAIRMKESDWDSVLDTNLKSVFRLSKAVLKGMMKARYGRIVSVTSVVASSGNAGQVNYAAAKAGIEGFSRSLAREIGSRGVTVNCVAPGFIDTDMTRGLREEVQASLLAQIPLARFGAPDDVASAVAFLSSREAAYITGSTVHVNGGMYMT